MASNRKFRDTSINRFAGKYNPDCRTKTHWLSRGSLPMRASCAPLYFTIRAATSTLGRQNKPLSTECFSAGRDFLGTPLVSRR